MANSSRLSNGRFAKKVPSKPAPYVPDNRSVQNEYREPHQGFVGNRVIPHQFTFAALWQQISRSYKSLDDEAKKNNYQNSLAMRRDAFIMKMLRARQLPVVELPFTIEVEDPHDPAQQKIANEITLMVNAIPRFQYLKLNLSEALWYGRAAVQITWDYVTIAGKKRLVPVSHEPVNGDKLVFKWDGTPGVLIYKPYHPDGADVEQTDRGPALFLRDEFYRDRFIINEFEPDDVDYLFESDLAGGVHGVGVRSRIYWVYQLRQELIAWTMSALQRISTNGLLVGRFSAANPNSQIAVSEALKELIETSVTTFPVDPGDENYTGIEAISPSNIGYETLMQWVEYFDDIMEVMVVGQSLASGTQPTGMGSGVAELHSLTFERIIRYDAGNLSECISKDLIKPIITYNYGELPFQVKFKIQPERTANKDNITSALALGELGVPLDADNLLDMAGLTAPSDPDNVVKVEQPDPQDSRVGEQDKLGDNTLHTELRRFSSGSNCGIGSGGFEPGNDCAAGGQGGSATDSSSDAPKGSPAPSKPSPKSSDEPAKEIEYENSEDRQVKIAKQHIQAKKDRQKSHKEDETEFLKTQKEDRKNLQKTHKDEVKDHEKDASKARKEFDKTQVDEKEEFEKGQKDDMKEFMTNHSQDLMDYQKELLEEMSEFRDDVADDPDRENLIAQKEAEQLQARRDFAGEKFKEMQDFNDSQKKERDDFEQQQKDDLEEHEKESAEELKNLTDQHVADLADLDTQHQEDHENLKEEQEQDLEDLDTEQNEEYWAEFPYRIYDANDGSMIWHGDDPDEIPGIIASTNGKYPTRVEESTDIPEEF